MIGINIAHKNGGNYFFPIPPLPQFFFKKPPRLKTMFLIMHCTYQTLSCKMIQIGVT